MPAYAAEGEARSRLGLEVGGTGARLIDAAIALRYPEDVADARDLPAAVRSDALSYAVLYADALERGIDRAASILAALGESSPRAVTGIATLLGISREIQTCRMAGAIVANAMIFHERLAAPLRSRAPVHPLRRGGGKPPNRRPRRAGRHSQDKLLAHLRLRARHPPPPARRRRRPAARRPPRPRRRRPRQAAPRMMRDVLYGCDVMPSAIHIAGSALSGAQPAVGFGKSRLYNLAYGRREDGAVRIGSLELLQTSSDMTLFNTGDPAMRTGGAGDETAGSMLEAPIGANGESWAAVRISDCSLAQTAFAPANSELKLPGELTAPISEIGKIGLVDRDINGSPPRGPFTKTRPSETATYPSLWNHSAERETRVICQPDSQPLVRMGMEEKAAAVWTAASRSHLNRGFTFGSHPLAVAFTENPSLGGAARRNAILDDERFDCAFAIWANSTLGPLSYWRRSSRQQDGRGTTTIRAAETLPILDLRALTDAQLTEARRVFDDFRERDLKPACLADADPNRAELDRRLTRDALGMDARTYKAIRRLSAKWRAEPSVHAARAGLGLWRSGAIDRNQTLSAANKSRPTLWA